MILYDTEYLQLKSTKSKEGSDWVYAHRPNTKCVVVIVPVINNSKVLFLIEERPPIIAEGIGARTIAFPAGLVGDVRKGETLLEAAQAELLEEAGLKASKIAIKAEKIATSPGCVSEIFTIAFAYIDDYQIVSEPVSDGGVIIDRVLVELDRIDDWLNTQQEQNVLLTSQSLAALYYLQKEKSL